jgi:hypothetical protein
VFVGAAKGKSLPAPLKTPYGTPINTLAGIRNELLLKNRKSLFFEKILFSTPMKLRKIIS